MQNRFNRVWAIPISILIIVGLYYVPPIHSRLAWRLESLRTKVQYLVKPPEEAVFQPTQQVVLQGAAYDLEDGTMADAAFAWSSSIDGGLGNGETLNTSELSTGSHVITLQVTDSDGMTGQVQRTIHVQLTGNSLYLPLILRGY